MLRAIVHETQSLCAVALFYKGMDMSNIQIEVCTLPHFGSLDLPKYETKSSAGMDLRAAVPQEQPIEIPPLGRVAVPTGLSMAIPQGWCSIAQR